MSSAVGLAKIGGIAGGIAGELLSSLLGDMVDAVGDIARTEAIIRIGVAKEWFAEAFDGMVEARPHGNIGVAPDGLIDVAQRMLKATAYFGLAVGSEVAEELFMEMIQEGYSNAIQTSIGGALQAMLNVWRGGMPPNPDELEAVVGKIVDLDENTFALLVSMTGCNLPTTFFRISRGFDQFVDEDVRLIREQLADVLTKMNSTITWLYERARYIAEGELEDALNVLKEIYGKGINLLDSIAERALSRLQELKIECETAKKWYEYTLAYPETPLITETEAFYVAVENREEAKATYNTYLSIKQTIENTLANADIAVDSIVAKIDEIVEKYVNHLNEMVKAGLIEYSGEIDKIVKAMEKVKAYRNAVENKTSLVAPVEFIGEKGKLYMPAFYSVLVYTEY